MTKHNKIMDKIKEGVSVQEVENFARKYTTEVFFVLAVVLGTISSMFDFFTGPKMTIIFVAAGMGLGVFFPLTIEKVLKQIYSYTSKSEKMTQMIIGIVQIVVAIFIPFVLFAVVGLLAGTSYHYYSRHAQIMGENKSRKSYRGGSSDEHD